MKAIKSLVIVAMLMIVLLLSGCNIEKDNTTNTEVVPVSYGNGIEKAKKEFYNIFASFEGLEITETSTMARTDDGNHFVVQFNYISQNGNGVYGFEYQKDTSGNIEIIRHGEDVTIDNLVGDKQK